MNWSPRLQEADRLERAAGEPDPAGEEISPRAEHASAARAGRRLFSIDLRSLAAFRIALALVILWDLFVRSLDLEAHYTDLGVMPRSLLFDSFLVHRTYFCVHLLHGSLAFQAILFAVAALFALSLLVGYRTQVAAAACWFLTCSLQARNPLITHGGDDLLRLLLFWSLFTPLGARWSIDRLRATCIDTDETAVVSWGTVGLMLQLCFMYLFSSAMKSHASWRHDGSAVYLALSIDQFATWIGHALLPYHGLLIFLTFSTLVIEMAGPFVAVFSFDRPWLRMFVVLAFIGFHIGLALCIELGIFPGICCAAWLLFLPAKFWETQERRLAPAIGRLLRRTTRPAAGLIERTLEFIPRRPLRTRIAPAANAMAAVILVYIVCWNVRASNYDRYAALFPTRANAIGELLRVDQYWNLFAPYPSLDHGWYVLDAHLRDGEEIDLMTGRPVTWVKPPLVSATYRNERWRKYMMNLWMGQYTQYRPAYAQYLQRTWDESHPPQRRLARLEVVFMLQTAVPPYGVTPPRRARMWSQDW